MAVSRLAIVISVAALGGGAAGDRTAAADTAFVDWSHWPDLVAISASDASSAPLGLAVFDGPDPVAFCVPQPTDANTFKPVDRPPATLTARRRAFPLTLPDLRRLEHWPLGGGPAAQIDAIGPGLRHVWLRIPAWTPVSLTTWWQCVRNQPVARFDQLFRADGLVFCRVTLLAAVAELDTQQPVEAWPLPADAHRGVLRSRVSQADPQAAAIVRIPTPPGLTQARAGVVDFFRDGEWLVSGLVEEVGERFTRVRVSLPGASQSARADTNPAGRDQLPAESDPVSPSDRRFPAVADEAVFRSAAALASGIAPIRVFDRAGDEWLLNGGERDRVAAGQSLAVFRDGRRVGTLRAVRVQSSYTRAQVDAGAVAIGDQVGQPAIAKPRRVAVVTQVADTIFSARRLQPVEVGAILPLSDAGEIVGMAVVLFVEADTIGGWVVTGTRTRPVRAGIQLVQPRFAGAHRKEQP